MLLDREKSRGSSYDRNSEYEVELASPSYLKKSLARVYDDFFSMKDIFKSMGKLKGMHKTDEFIFKEDETTNLLLAKTKGGFQEKVEHEGLPNNISVSFNLEPDKKIIDAQVITDKITNKKD